MRPRGASRLTGPPYVGVAARLTAWGSVCAAIVGVQRASARAQQISSVSALIASPANSRLARAPPGGLVAGAARVADDDGHGASEPRARAQARRAGAFVIFLTQQRPNKTGYDRVGMRHGVATVTRGRRTAMGVIFHDAR